MKSKTLSSDHNTRAILDMSGIEFEIGVVRSVADKTVYILIPDGPDCTEPYYIKVTEAKTLVSVIKHAIKYLEDD